jgi:hypothetical protein
VTLRRPSLRARLDSGLKVVTEACYVAMALSHRGTSHFRDGGSGGVDARGGTREPPPPGVRFYIVVTASTATTSATRAGSARNVAVPVARYKVIDRRRADAESAREIALAFSSRSVGASNRTDVFRRELAAAGPRSAPG